MLSKSKHLVVFIVIVFLSGISKVGSSGASTMSSGIADPQPAYGISRIPLEASRLQKYPYLRGITQSMLAEQPALNSFVVTQSRQNHKGVTLSIVFGRHYYSATNHEEDAVDPLALDSQKQITGFLSTLQPRLLAVEGFTGDVSAEGMVNTVFALNTDLAKAFDSPLQPRSKYVRDVDRRLRDYAAYQYTKKHPEVVSMGIENQALLQFNVLTTQHLSKYREFDDLVAASTQARNEYALAVMLASIKAKGLTTGTMVIGADHGPDLVALTKRWKVKTNFYLAAPKGEDYSRFLQPAY